MRTIATAQPASRAFSRPSRATAEPRLRFPVPDLALMAAFVTLFYAFFLFNGSQAFFRDSDAGWHIVAGRQMLATFTLPRTDPFSFTAAGRPWFAWEWLSDIAVAAIHTSLGLGGVAFFYGCAIASGVWLWFRLNWLAGGNFLLAALFAAPMLSTANLHWLARPHVLSWLFLLATVAYAIRPRPLTPLTGSLLALSTVLWTQIHASFFMAPVIFLIFAAGHALTPVLWNIPATPLAKHFLTCAAIAFAASFVNPYGWHLHAHVFSYITDNALLDRVGEFQTFNFHAEGAAQILLALALSTFGGILALSERNLPVCFLSLFLVAAALRSARGLPLVALMALPLANGILTRALASWPGLRPQVRRALDGFLAYSTRLRALDATCSGLLWAPLVALAFFTLLRTPAFAAHTGFPPDQFPVAAAPTLERLPADARIFAPDKFGGYLIYRFAGQRKVFFDGRSDLYGADFLKQYARMVQVRPGWNTIFNSYRFTHALLPADYSLIPALEQTGWKPIYHDAVATLLVRPE